MSMNLGDLSKLFEDDLVLSNQKGFNESKRNISNISINPEVILNVNKHAGLLTVFNMLNNEDKISFRLFLKNNSSNVQNPFVKWFIDGIQEARVQCESSLSIENNLEDYSDAIYPDEMMADDCTTVSSGASKRMPEYQQYQPTKYMKIVSNVDVVSLEDVSAMNEKLSNAIKRFNDNKQIETANMMMKVTLQWCRLNCKLNTSSLDFTLVMSAVHLIAYFDRCLLNKRDQSMSTLLYYFCLMNNVEGVKALLLNKVDVNLVNDGQTSPLIVAVQAKNERLVKMLLEAGAKVRHRDGSGLMALDYAAECGAITIAGLLQQSYPRLLKDYRNIKTPLHIACAAGQKDFVERLLADGNIPIDALDEDGNTGLLLACLGNHVAIISLLLQKNANVEIVNVKGRSALHESRLPTEWHIALCRPVLTKCITAVKCNDFSTIQYCHSLGLDLNATDEVGNPCLLLAVEFSSDEVINLLIRLGARVNSINSDRVTPLMQACTMGRVSLIVPFLNCGADLNAVNVDGDTALHFAATNGHVNIIKILMHRCVTAKIPLNINAMNKERRTALRLAVIGGHKECVDFLTVCGASYGPSPNENSLFPMDVVQDPTASQAISMETQLQIIRMLNRLDQDLLYHSAKFGLVHRVQYYLKQPKVSINEKIKDMNFVQVNDKLTEVTTQETALYVACNFGYVDVVRYLLEKGADPNILARNGWSCLFVASKKGFIDIVRLLVAARADTRFKNKNNMSCLNIAAYGGYVTIVHELLNAGAEVNCSDKMGSSPLHAAVQSGVIEILELLVSHGADLNVTTMSDISPLYVASFEGFTNMVRFLLQQKVDVNKSNKDKTTAVMVAAFNGKTEVVQMLVDAGADLYINVASKTNALINAAQNGHVDVMVILIKAGMNVNSVTENGNTALHKAAASNHLEAVKLLMYHGANAEVKNVHDMTALFFAAENGHLDTVSYLIDIVKVDVNVANNFKVTPLNIAAQNGHQEVVRKLLTSGANVNIIADKGPSPLFIAAQNGHLEVCRDLVEYKAELNVACKEGETAVFVACYFGFYEIAQLLIEAGATFNDIDVNGRTPLWWSSRSGKTNIVKLLLKHKADITISDADGITPLAIAKQESHTEICELLSAVTTPCVACSICYQNPRNVVFLPCKHLPVCRDCSFKLERAKDNHCPICREEIKDRICVYL